MLESSQPRQTNTESDLDGGKIVSAGRGVRSKKKSDKKCTEYCSFLFTSAKGAMERGHRRTGSIDI